jgi:ribosomal protein S10
MRPLPLPKKWIKVPTLATLCLLRNNLIFSAKAMLRQFKSEVHQRLIYLNRILQMVFYSQATFSVYC